MKIKWCPNEKIWKVGYEVIQGSNREPSFEPIAEFKTFQEAWAYKKKMLRRKS